MCADLKSGTCEVRAVAQTVGVRKTPRKPTKGTAGAFGKRKG